MKSDPKSGISFLPWIQGSSLWINQISGLTRSVGFQGIFENFHPSIRCEKSLVGFAAHRWAVNGRGGLDFNVDSAARRRWISSTHWGKMQWYLLMATRNPAKNVTSWGKGSWNLPLFTRVLAPSHGGWPWDFWLPSTVLLIFKLMCWIWKCFLWQNLCLKIWCVNSLQD